MASDPKKTDAEYIAQARKEYQRDGECEIDDNAVISRNDAPGESGGAYVQAWVWCEDEPPRKRKGTKRGGRKTAAR